MGKKRFFDDRLKYLSFIQNTGEKKAISEKIYPYIAGLSEFWMLALAMEQSTQT